MLSPQPTGIFNIRVNCYYFFFSSTNYISTIFTGTTFYSQSDFLCCSVLEESLLFWPFKIKRKKKKHSFSKPCLLKGASPTHIDEKDKHQQKKAPQVKMIVSVYLHCTSSALSVKTENKTLIQQRMLLRHFHKMLPRHFHKMLPDKKFLFSF